MKPQSKRIEQSCGGRARGRALERDQFSNARARRARPEAPEGGGERGGRARIGGRGGAFFWFKFSSWLPSSLYISQSRDISMDGRC